MKVDEFFKKWTGQRPNLCTAFHEAGIEAMAFAEAYHKQQVKLLAAPAVSVNEVAVCPRCKSKEVSVKPITYDCYECGATWQTER